MKGLARTHAARGVRVNAVSPGAVYFEGGTWEWNEKNDPELFAQLLDANPTGRMGRPDEIANAVVFLASRAASFITGVNVVVDGGFTQRIQF
jgi:NAD(P)-dependent dehydrogenase (short-subunit alcohol dehydrogenase family)